MSRNSRRDVGRPHENRTKLVDTPHKTDSVLERRPEMKQGPRELSRRQRVESFLARRREGGVEQIKKNDSTRFDELVRKKNLSDSESRELKHELNAALDKTDPHRKETDQLVKQGDQEFRNNGKARREFCHVAGTEEHKRWENELEKAEQKAGRIKGVDYAVEAVHKHPDGKPVRLDHVDYSKDVITDRKAIAEGETEEQVTSKHEDQRQRHIEAYEHSTGRKVSEYRYSLYPSAKDISDE